MAIQFHVYHFDIGFGWSVSDRLPHHFSNIRMALFQQQHLEYQTGIPARVVPA